MMRNWQIGMLGALSTAMAVGCSADGVSGTEASQDRGAPGESLGVARQSLVASCAFPDPSDFPIKFDTEMIIRSRSVVDDPCRTSWTATGCGTRLGQWTFGQLMANMSGSGLVTDPSAQHFVGKLMQNWLFPQTVGMDPNPVQARANFRPSFLNPWLAASAGCGAGANPATCPLDLKKAPFRLLAITNRIDMSGSGYGSSMTGPGELRFAFGALGAGGARLNAVFILEYKYPSTKSAQEWGTLFHGLSNPTLALPTVPTLAPITTPFADQLQNITDLVVGPNVEPGAPNGSSIGQIRTNENAFDPIGVNNQWEFRQFKLSCGSGTPCDLEQVPVSQTPPTTANNTAAVGDFLINNQFELSTSQHIVPSALLGGSSLSPRFQPVVWESLPNPVVSDPMAAPTESEALVRHNFAFATCNGCHYLETANQSLQFHIAPRNPTSASALSQFLGFANPLDPDGSDPTMPAFLMEVPDPAGGDVIFQYNEPWRRACEMKRVLQGDTTARTSATGHSIF